MPGIAQTKPFAGVTLRGASFQHRFFTLLQNYIPEFEAQTGMKVDLQLSAFPVYNQQANLELSSGGSAFDFVNVTFILAARWVAAGLLANLDEFTGDPNLTPAEWKPKDFVEGAQVPYRDAKGATYGYSWEGGRHGDGPLPHGPDGEEGAEDSKDLRRAAAGLRRDQRHRRRHRPRQLPASSLVPAALHPGLWRQYLPQSAHRHHAGAELAGSDPGGSNSTRTC
jgi:hypothetical protein